MIHPMRFSSQAELYRFSELASKESYPIHISTNAVILDARSILALMTLLGKDVMIVAPDHISAQVFGKFIQRYEKQRFPA